MPPLLTVTIDMDPNLPKDLKQLEKNLSNVMQGPVGKSLIQQLRNSTRRSINRALKKKNLIRTGGLKKSIKTRLNVSGGVLFLNFYSNHPAAEILDAGGQIRPQKTWTTKRGKIMGPLFIFMKEGEYKYKWRPLEIKARNYLSAIEEDVVSHIPKQLQEAFRQLKLRA